MTYSLTKGIHENETSVNVRNTNWSIQHVIITSFHTELWDLNSLCSEGRSRHVISLRD